MRDDILQPFANHRAKVVTFRPHTTTILPCLDLGLFDILKKEMSSKVSFGSDDSVGGFITHICHNLKQTLVPDNVRSAFILIGIQHSIDVEPYFLVLDEFALRDSPGFFAIWKRDYPPEQLSP
jgi:hypothetical protein